MAGLLACAVGLLVLAVMAGPLWQMLSASIVDLAAIQNAPIEDILEIGIQLIGWTMILTVAPLVVTIFIVGFVTTMIYNGGFVFSMHPIKPQLSRLSIKNGFTRIYGRRGWMEFGISSVRLIVWFLLAGFIAAVWAPEFLRSPLCGVACLSAIAHPLAWIILIAAIIILLLACAAEAVIQRNQFLHEQKMTKTEVKRERKDQSGSPELRRERRRLRKKNQEPYAKPGVTRGNLCFYSDDMAVIIRYAPPKEEDPFVVAKIRGKDKVAETRKKMQDMGRYESEEAELVSRLWQHELGDRVNAEHLPLLGGAMRRMFEQ